ncbi:hypothetical protein J1C51_22145 [Chromobacterium haemolyticum]|uniref:hypothetical protein n=1 Tax=Chromobacterium haemolyticum TaxID=394935 RepID=UPI001A911146|nr:hypothetical protein [Chromobacterium haemolyticum]MBO0501475.1 hypothetical protein [Chromobacterium haemolyticum]
MDDGKRGELQESLRSRWPKGVIGAIRYFTDHVIYRYKRPVDWSGLYAMEEAFTPGYPVWAGGFAILNDDEEAVFRLLGEEGGSTGPIRAKLGMTEEELEKHLGRLKQKLGAASVSELAVIARQHEKK